MNAILKYNLAIFLRRLPLFLLVSVTISSAALAIALVLPTIYTARGTLLVEDPQIPTTLARSTVVVNELEQLAIIRQRLMTRANLLDIAREYQIYEDLEEISPDQIVQRMRSDTGIRNSGRRDAATLMNISFRARSPEVSAQVVNEYITRVLAENADQRTNRATQTLAFFQQEAERLQTELNLQNEKILRFQNENSDSLPSTLDYRLARQSQLEERLETLSRERTQLEEQRASLVELRESGRRLAGPVATAPGERTVAERQLADLQNQLTNTLIVYAESSPRVQMLRARVEALEAQVEEARLAALDVEGLEGEVPPDPVTAEIAELDARVAEMDERASAIERDLLLLTRSIERTPGNAIALDSLRRDYQNIQRQYNQAVDRLSQAQTGERIETMSAGSRITVIEQATTPNEPSDPNRPLIAGAGAAAGLGAGIGLIVLLELLNKAIRRPVDLTHALGITPVAVIPYIATPLERLRRRLILLLVALAVLAGVPAMLWYVHYDIMPLDLIYDRVLTELMP